MKTPLFISTKAVSASDLWNVCTFLENLVKDNNLPVDFHIACYIQEGENTVNPEEFSKVKLHQILARSPEEAPFHFRLNALRAMAGSLKNCAIIPLADFNDILSKDSEWFKVRYEPFEADPLVSFIGYQALLTDEETMEMIMRLRKYITFSPEDFKERCFFEEKLLMQNDIYDLSINSKFFDLVGGFQDRPVDLQIRGVLMGYKFLPLKA